MRHTQHKCHGVEAVTRGCSSKLSCGNIAKDGRGWAAPEAYPEYGSKDVDCQEAEEDIVEYRSSLGCLHDEAAMEKADGHFDQAHGDVEDDRASSGELWWSRSAQAKRAEHYCTIAETGSQTRPWEHSPD